MIGTPGMPWPAPPVRGHEAPAPAAALRGRLAAAVVALAVATVSCTPQRVEEPVTLPIDVEALMTAVHTLADPGMEGRGAGTDGGARARAWIAERFRAIGLDPVGEDYQLPFEFAARPDGTPTRGVNLAGVCASDDEHAPVIVVSAHYDHLGIRNGEVFHGADDNASGVAVLLALAEQCRQRPFLHTLMFVAFDAEEHGLQGARAFVVSPPVALDRVRLNVNMDMVSRGDRGELYAAGTYHYPWLGPPLEEVAARAPVALRFGHDRPEDGTDDWTMQSDHGAFHEAGIPFVYFGVEDHPDYHRPTDTPDRIDAVFFGRAAETILDALRSLDAMLISR
jgi:hypothetical protein